jgi:hypothetical protein
MAERAGGNNIYITLQNARYIGYGFALAQPHFCGRKIEHMPAELPHSHLEAETRTQRRLLEKQRQRFVAEGCNPSPGLELDSVCQKQFQVGI